jgi:2-polyprenyl-3-methyl-5-hydroxy-6-metoxy-1,4-benzoquinol methylase
MISKLYFDKHRILMEKCKGKKVLDLGIVDHDVKYETRKRWLHRDLKKVSKEILGLDIDKESIEILKKRGYNVKFGNVENFNLKEKFERIIAGDIMEHLNNIGNFLECAKKHMHKDSELIITVPNCLSCTNWIEVLLFGRIKYFNEEHTVWYDEATIKRILENYNLKIEEISFVCHNPHFIGESSLRYFLKNIRHSFLKIICKLRKQFSQTIFIRVKLGEKK